MSPLHEGDRGTVLLSPLHEYIEEVIGNSGVEEAYVFKINALQDDQNDIENELKSR